MLTAARADSVSLAVCIDAQLLHLRPSNIKKFVIEFVDTKIELAKTRDDWDL